MVTTHDFSVGLVAPTDPPRLFCHIEVKGMGLFLGELGPDGNYSLVEESMAKEFSYPEAYGICPLGAFVIFSVDFKQCRRVETPD